MMALGNVVSDGSRTSVRRQKLTLAATQLVSFDTAAALTASDTERFKATVKSAAGRIAEPRVKSLAGEIA